MRLFVLLFIFVASLFSYEKMSLMPLGEELKERHPYLNHFFALESFGDIYMRYQSMFRTRMIIFYVCNETEEDYKVELTGQEKRTFADVPAKGCANVHIGIEEYETALPTHITFGPAGSNEKRTRTLGRFEYFAREFRLINLDVKQYQKRGRWYFEACNTSKRYTEKLTLTLMDESKREHAFKPSECKIMPLDASNRYINYELFSSAYDIAASLEKQTPFAATYKKVSEGVIYKKWHNLTPHELHLCTRQERVSHSLCSIRVGAGEQSGWHLYDDTRRYGEKVLLRHDQNGTLYSFFKEGKKYLGITNTQSDIVKVCFTSGSETACELVAPGRTLEREAPQEAYGLSYETGISRALFDAADRNDMKAVCEIAAYYYATNKARYATHALKLYRFAAENGHAEAMVKTAALIEELLEREGEHYDRETKKAAEEEMRFWKEQAAKR